MEFRIVLGEVPEPEHMPVGRAYKDDLSIAIVQPQTPLGHLMKNLPRAVTYQEWETLINNMEDRNLNPRLAWENPDTHIPDTYWDISVTQETIPPKLRA